MNTPNKNKHTESENRVVAARAGRAEGRGVVSTRAERAGGRAQQLKAIDYMVMEQD